MITVVYANMTSLNNNNKNYLVIYKLRNIIIDIVKKDLTCHSDSAHRDRPADSNRYRAHDLKTELIGFFKFEFQ